MNNTLSFDLNSYPMGPKLRDYLRISNADYRGDGAPAPSEKAQSEFTGFLRAQDKLRTLDAEAVVDLIDELVTMALPGAARELAAARPDAIAPADFRAQLALGVAAMMAADEDGAEAHLRAAQATLPQEPAPYVNLGQILIAQDRLDEAEVWLLAGLDAEPNNVRMWDLLAESYQLRYGEYMADKLMALAEKRCSWAGLSLAANLTTTGDRYLKSTLLEKLYHQGERDHQFLVELTGAYGISGDFGKIAPLVWQAERMATSGLPWQLHVHCAQAQLALGENEAAQKRLAKAQADKTLPEDAAAALHELAQEIAETVALGEAGRTSLH